MTRVMPIDDPRLAGLTNHGRAQSGDELQRVAARSPPVLVQPDVRRHRHAVGRQRALGRDLVHADCRREHAGSDVGHADRLQQALQGPVLATRPVQHREDHVGAGQRVRADDRTRQGSWSSIARAAVGGRRAASTAPGDRRRQTPSRPMPIATMS